MKWSWSIVLGGTSALLLASCGSAAAPASPPSAAAPSAVSSAAAPVSSANPASSASAKLAASAGANAEASAKPASSAAASIAPAAPGTMLASYSELTPINAPLWLAADKGLFDKQGLKIDLRLVESSLGVGALLSDEVKFAAMGGSESLAAAVNGADLVVLATLSPVYPYKFEVSKDIKTATDLKGKKVGISRIGSSSDSATHAALKKLGVNPDDVNIVQVGSLSARMAALFNGNLDAAVAALPDTLKLEDQGFHPLLDLAAAKLPAVNNTLVARRGWLSANKDVAQKYVNALVEGIVLGRKDKASSIEMIQKYLKGRGGDKRALDDTYDFYFKQVFRVPPVTTSELFRDSIDQLTKKEPKASTFDVNKIIDNSFAEAASKRPGMSSS